MQPETGFEGDMTIRRQNTLDLVKKTIDCHHGCTLMVYEENPILMKAYVDAGVRMFEVMSGSIYDGRGGWPADAGGQFLDEYTDGGTPLDVRARNLRVARRIVGNDSYITLPWYGCFTAPIPIPFTDTEAMALSAAGANGCHVHKWDLRDLEYLVKVAHRNGLVVDAYISHPNEKYYYWGIPARSPSDVSKVAKRMEKIGVDMIGLLSGMTYEVKATEMRKETRARIGALVSTVNVPTIVEGGINLQNFSAFKETGLDIIIIYTSFKDMIVNATMSAAKKVLEHRASRR
jgi:hypothetical protein